jgi:hypothetical protein
MKGNDAFAVPFGIAMIVAPLLGALSGAPGWGCVHGDRSRCRATAR